MSVQFDLVGFTTTTTGTGTTIAVGGAVPDSGLRTLAGAGIPDGTVVSYALVTGSGASVQRETGTATVASSGTQLTGRTLVSSTTDSLISLVGTSTVMLGPNKTDFGRGGIEMATAKLLGRSTAGLGSAEEITLGTNLSFSGNTLNAAGGGGSPAGTGTELQYRNAGAFGGFGSWNSATSTLRLPENAKIYTSPTYNVGFSSAGDGYIAQITNRYNASFLFKTDLVLPGEVGGGLRFSETTGPYVTTRDKSNAASPPSLNVFSNGLKQLWLWGQYGGPYASSTNFHHGTGVTLWAGYGATPTTTNAAGGDAGNIDVWLNAGGAGNGTGAAGARGKLRVVNDATDAEVWSVDQLGVMRQTVPGAKPVYTVVTLPVAAGSDTGDAWVSDSSIAWAGNTGNIVAGGGSNKVPVKCDGTNWRIG
jgi:hypothetical protein